MGPKVVPKELIPPVKFKRWAPDSLGPRATTKGLAQVCCNEKPRATIKNAESIKLKDPLFTAGIIANAPTTDNNKPITIPFL